MNKIKTYYYALKNYFRTEKGRRDGIDFLRALALMIIVMLSVFIIMLYIKGAG